MKTLSELEKTSVTLGIEVYADIDKGLFVVADLDQDTYGIPSAPPERLKL